MKFSDIPQFPHSNYVVDVQWRYLEEHLNHWNDRLLSGAGLNLNPDFQRGHVWTPSQQSSYIEYRLKGGFSGKDIYFNCSSWGDGYNTMIYCVDGLQRITAALAFLNNEIRAFGIF